MATLRKRQQASRTVSSTDPPITGDGGFDVVDKRLRGKYAHIPVTEDDQEEYGPFPWIFTRIPPLSWTEIILSPFVFFIGLPFRLFAALIAVIGIGLGTFVLTYGCHIDNPVTGWRKHAHMWVAWAGARAWLFACGYFWITVEGERDMLKPDSPPIVVGNHVGWIDPVVFIFTHPCPGYVTREVTRGIPIIGRLTWQSNSLYVCRDDKVHQERNAIVQQKINMVAEKWPLHVSPMVIFPEGTSTNGKCLLEFKDGAFDAGAPIQPVCLRFCKDGPFVAMEHGTPLWILFNILCTTRHSLHISYLPTYHPNAAEKADPSLYARNVRAVMAKHLDVPVVDGMALRERYLWFDHVYHRTTTKEEYLAKRDEIRNNRNGGRPITLTYPDGRVEKV